MVETLFQFGNALRGEMLKKESANLLSSIVCESERGARE